MQCSTVLNNRPKINKKTNTNMYITNNQKLIMTTISCEFYWPYHANFRLKYNISIPSEKDMETSLKTGLAPISLAAQKI